MTELLHISTPNILRKVLGEERGKPFSILNISFTLIRNDSITFYDDVIMGTITSQIIGLTIVYSTVYSDAAQRKHQSFASLAFVRGISQWPVSPHTNGQWRRKFFHLMTSSCLPKCGTESDWGCRVFVTSSKQTVSVRRAVTLRDICYTRPFNQHNWQR